MKFRVLIFLASLIFLFSCNNENEDSQAEKFVHIEDGKFKIYNENYSPLMINYAICLREVNGQITLSPIQEYDFLDKFEGNSKDSVLNIIDGHIQMIKEMGFNTIRLIGIDRMDYDDETGEVVFKVYENGKIIKYPFHENSELYFNKIDDFLEIAEKHELKIMVLLPRPVNDKTHNNSRLEFIRQILKEYKNNPTIFSYDFFNEPLYFDKHNLKPGQRQRKKEEAYDIASEWKKMMEEHAPNQLFTIGFSEPLEVFEWDPSILPVDFVQMHTYHPLRVPNEIYWYSKYIDKPWIIGETSLPADNDSISYQEQAQFMREAYKRTVNCGGIGFGWWQYQETNWGGFEHDYTALINHKGKTYTKDKKHFIHGSLKPAAHEIKKLKDYKPTNECPCMENYKNMLGYENIVLKGKVINGKTDKPIEGAVIRGWTKYWRIGANTFTDAKGNFELYSNKEFVHFAVSAPGMTLEKFDFKANYKPTYKHDYKLETLEDQDIKYSDINYLPFLASDSINKDIKENKDTVIFNFDKEKFKNAKFEGKMKDIVLDELNL